MATSSESSLLQLVRLQNFLLPKSTIEQLFELDANATHDPIGVDRTIDSVLRNQSRHVRDSLDLPPYYDRLPFAARWHIKDILYDSRISYERKLALIHDVIRAMPQKVQQRLATPPTLRDDNESSTTKDDIEQSRYFEAFSTLQYHVSFNFVSLASSQIVVMVIPRLQKLSELKHALSPTDARLMIKAIGDSRLDVDVSFGVA